MKATKRTVVQPLVAKLQCLSNNADTQENEKGPVSQASSFIMFEGKNIKENPKMLISDESRQKFGEALAQGLGALLGRASNESWLTKAQCLAGHVSIAEALRGGPAAANIFAKQVEAISPAITSVQMQPMSMGEPATYSIGITFDPKAVEALYSDGKSAMASLEKDGKKYVIDKDGKAVPVEDPDKYINNLNKTTGSRYQKTEGAEDIRAELLKLVDEANVALDGTGVEVALNGDRIAITGDVALVKPTQGALPDPLFGLDDLEGGYNAEAGAVEVTIPKFADTRDIANLEDFLYKAVNIVLDAYESGACTPGDEWAQAYGAAEADPAYAARYAYAGESFVGSDKAKGAKLVKSLMAAERFDDAEKVAAQLMGKQVAESLVVRPTARKVSESKQPIALDEEAALLDLAHESAVSALPHQDSCVEDLINPNLV